MKQAKLQAFFSRAPAAQAPTQIEEHANQHKAEPERQHLIWGLIVGHQAGSWSREFMQQLEAESLLALLCTSTAGRDKALARLRSVHMQGACDGGRLCRLHDLLDRAGVMLECLTVDDLPATPSIKDAPPRWKTLRITQQLRLSVLDTIPLAPGLEIIFSTTMVVCDTTADLHLKRLTGVRLTCEVAGISPGVHMKTPQNQAAALSQGFKLLSMCPASPADYKPAVNGNILGLIDWSMSPAVLDELPNMPRWASLEFGSVKWLPRRTYATLLGSLPDSLDTICLCRGGGSTDEELGSDALSDKQVISLAMGAPRHRAKHLEIQLSHRADRHRVWDTIETGMSVGLVGEWENVSVVGKFRV